MSSPLRRIAIVGCGAIAHAHANAISAIDTARCTVVYDVNQSRSEAFRSAVVPDARIANTLDEIAKHAELAIVAVPNAYHASTALPLLAAGLHVLCEKPLALSTDEARTMYAAASTRKRVLACGLVRRFFGSTRLVREALSADLIGPAQRVEVREAVRNWPMGRASFDRSVAGGGVFIDMAPHIVDLLHHWLGPTKLLEYRDDAEGGVEAVAAARLSCATSDGEVPVELYLTRAHGSINRTRIWCSRGCIEVQPHDRDSIDIIFGIGVRDPFRTTARSVANDPFVAQLKNVLNAIDGQEPLAATAAEVVGTVELIESAYRTRNPMTHSWSTAIVPSARCEPSFRKILVTGASGAVGSRLVEMWAAEGRLAQLRCLIRGYRNAARLKRFDAEIVEADLVDAKAVRRAAEGCDAIVHLGVGEHARAETESVVAAASALGIRRLVHMSSAAVYGRGMPTALEAAQELTPPHPTGEPYADAKAAAERVVLAARGSLDAVILRPHMVYGPGMRWTGELFELLPQHRIAAIDDGGWCNLIYVDDLVRAIDHGLTTMSGFHQPVFITDGHPIRWCDYILAHAHLAGVEPPHVRRSEVMPPRRSIRGWLRDSLRPIVPVIRSAEFRAFVFESPAVQATVFPLYLSMRTNRALGPWLERARSRRSSTAVPSVARRFDPTWTELQLSEARLRPDRAAEAIGFRARVSFDEGLRRCREWAAEFGLLSKAAAGTARDGSGASS